MHLTARGCVIALMGALGMIVLFFWVTGVNASNASPPPPPTPQAAKPPAVVVPAPPAVATTPAPTTTAKAEPAPVDKAKPPPAIKAALLSPAGPAAPSSHVKRQPKSKTGKPQHAAKHSGKATKKTAKRAHH